MFCWRCAHPVTEGSQYCANCGAPTQGAPAAAAPGQAQGQAVAGGPATTGAQAAAYGSAWPGSQDFTETVHRQELLYKKRCSLCAERIPAKVILQGAECPKCGQSVAVQSGTDVEAIVSKMAASWRRLRVKVIVLIIVGNVLGGWLPILPAFLLILAFVIVHAVVVRPQLRWLSLKRRVTTRFTLKLIMVAFALVKAGVHLLVMPIPGFHWIAAIILGLIGTVVYASIAQKIVANRLHREMMSDKLDTGEWLVPAGVLGAMVTTSVILIGTLIWAVNWIQEAEIPGADDIVGWILHS